jgi:hypothetical protein
MATELVNTVAELKALKAGSHYFKTLHHMTLKSEEIFNGKSEVDLDAFSDQQRTQEEHKPVRNPLTMRKI